MKYPKTPRYDFTQLSTEVNIYAKIKLHGTFACLYTDRIGKVTPGSRKYDIGVECGEHYGFRAYSNKHWNKLNYAPRNSLIFGEWCGDKIQNKGICTVLKQKRFFIFGIAVEGVFYWKPEIIEQFLPRLPYQAEILPLMFPESFTTKDYLFLTKTSEEINKEDPFVKEWYDVSCWGEGLVLMPESFKYSDNCLLRNSLNLPIGRAEGFPTHK